jgi:multicomponent Na+:H+ antiporter subunit E
MLNTEQEHANAQTIANGLPVRSQQTTLHCPLCGATVPSRGVIYRTLSSGERWELTFICPTCGLYTTFDTQHLKIEQIARLHGSQWAAELRQPEHETDIDESASPVQQTDPVAHYLTTFIACAVLWLILTGSFAPLDLLWGVVLCTIVSALTYRFTAFGAPRWMRRPRGWLALMRLFVEFVRQMVVQNVTLSWRVFLPKMPIKPGIVAVPYNISGDVPLTIMTSLMTLTPDTVVIDIDQQKKLMYIHWINVQTTDPQEMHRLIIHDIEHRVIDWLKDN